MTDTAEQLVLDLAGSFPDFPSAGILFRDLTPVFARPGALSTVARALIEALVDDRAGEAPVDAIVGVESRGFAIAAAMAVHAGCGMVPVRKAGKLPGEVFAETYALEYGDDELELQVGVLPAGSRVLLVDDLLATGGTLAASVRLLERARVEVVGIGVVLELDGLHGRAAIADHRIAAIASLPA